jgi:hypothetical protein
MASIAVNLLDEILKRTTDEGLALMPRFDVQLVAGGGFSIECK